MLDHIKWPEEAITLCHLKKRDLWLSQKGHKFYQSGHFQKDFFTTFSNSRFTPLWRAYYVFPVKILPPYWSVHFLSNFKRLPDYDNAPLREKKTTEKNVQQDFYSSVNDKSVSDQSVESNESSPPCTCTLTGHFIISHFIIMQLASQSCGSSLMYKFDVSCRWKSQIKYVISINMVFGTMWASLRIYLTSGVFLYQSNSNKFCLQLYWTEKHLRRHQTAPVLVMLRIMKCSSANHNCI